jgi:hypothetical protein
MPTRRSDAALRVILALALAMPLVHALADEALVGSTDPIGLFSLAHPAGWTVDGSEGNVALYGSPFATLVQVSVVPVDMLPTTDADVLGGLVVEGQTVGWDDLEVSTADEVVLAGRAMHTTVFEGVDLRPVRVERQGVLHLAATEAHVVMVVYTLPTAVAEEVLPEIEAVLGSLAFTD